MKSTKNAWQLPAIGGSHKYPGLAGNQFGRDAVANKVKSVNNFIIQFVCQHLRTVTAVASAGEINNYG